MPRRMAGGARARICDSPSARARRRARYNRRARGRASSRGAPSARRCSTSTTRVLADRARGVRAGSSGMKVAHSRRRHVLLHGAGDARARLPRRLGSRAGVPGDRAVRDRLRARRAFRASTGTRAKRFRSSGTPSWSPFAARRCSRRGASRSRCTATRTRTSRTASSFRRRPIPSAACATGCTYLRETLGAPISVFVPPHNALSKRGLAAVSAAGLNLLGSFLSFRPSMRPWDRAHARELVAGAPRIARRPAASKRDRFVYPHVLRYRRHAEFGCHSLIPERRSTSWSPASRKRGAPAATSASRRITGKWTRR